MKTHIRLAAAFTLVLALSGCALALRSPSVADLHRNPSRYYDRTVTVDGVVTDSWGIPLVPLRFYRIDDGTGTLTVVSQGLRTPTRGTHVRVRGRVNELGVFGGRSIGMHVQERDLYIKRG